MLAPQRSVQPAATEWQVGDPIAGTQYRYLRELGRGVQGVAIEVEHAFLSQISVMKLLHAQHVGRTEIASRVRAEARALVALRHRNIVRVTDGGMTAEREPRPFFVMERLRGDTLRAALRGAGGPLPLRDTLDMAIDVLDALDHAHAKCMVHRDVKPANIFLARGGVSEKRAMLLDFGIVAVIEPGADRRAGFSGTYEYAAPEQLDGYLTAQSDLYAMGMVIHYCLLGHHPFARLAQSRDDLRRLQRECSPAPLSSQIEVPEALSRVLAQAVAKDPAQRPKNAFAFAQKLRDVRVQLRGMVAPAAQPSPHDDASGHTDEILQALRAARTTDLGPGGRGSPLRNTGRKATAITHVASASDDSSTDGGITRVTGTTAAVTRGADPVHAAVTVLPANEPSVAPRSAHSPVYRACELHEASSHTPTRPAVAGDETTTQHYRPRALPDRPPARAGDVTSATRLEARSHRAVAPARAGDATAVLQLAPRPGVAPPLAQTLASAPAARRDTTTPLPASLEAAVSTSRAPRVVPAEGSLRVTPRRPAAMLSRRVHAPDMQQVLAGYASREPIIQPAARRVAATVIAPEPRRRGSLLPWVVSVCFALGAVLVVVLR